VVALLGALAFEYRAWRFDLTQLRWYIRGQAGQHSFEGDVETGSPVIMMMMIFDQHKIFSHPITCRAVDVLWPPYGCGDWLESLSRFVSSE
jgi:hypothetical protein